MSRKAMLYTARVCIVAGIFSAGYLCGNLNQHSANAQMEELGGELLKKAGQSGGTLGSVVQLGMTINEMDKHASALQKNLDTLRKVKAALGGH